MNKELLMQRLEALQKEVELGAGELNKLFGKVEEARMWLHYIEDKEKNDQE